MKNLIYLITIHFLIPFCLCAVEWEYIGGPSIGGVKEIEKDSKGNLFMASMNGIWKSTDKGESWFQVYNHITFTGIRTNAISNCLSIAIDSKDRIYAINLRAITDGEGSNAVISEDGGATWKDITGNWRKTGDDTYPMIVEIDVEDNVYVCIEVKDSKFPNIILYKTNDQGKTWSVFNTKKIKEVDVNNFKIANKHLFIRGRKVVKTYQKENNNKGVVYSLSKKDSVWKEILFSEYEHISCVEEIGENEFWVGTDYGLYKTTDNGNSFALMDNNKFNGIYNIIYISEKELYIKCYNGAYLSTDKGKSFNKIEITTHSKYIDYFNFINIGSNLLKYDEHTYFSLAWLGVNKSIDKCKTWDLSTNGFVSSTMIYLSTDKNNNLLAAIEGGLEAFRYNSNEKTWEDLNLYAFGVRSIYFAPDNNIYAGTISSKGKLSRSTDHGKTWEKFIEGIPENVYFFDLKMTRDGILYGGSEFGVVFRSTNKGESWEMDFPPNGCGSTAIGINSEGHVFISNETVYIARSKTGWDDWEIVNDEYAKEYEGPKIYDHSWVMSIEFHPTEPVGYAVTEDYSKFKTTDNGNTWFIPPDSEIFENPNVGGSPLIASKDIALDSLGNFIVVGNYGIWMTTNLGEKWIRIDSGMQHVKFNRVEVSPSGYIYVAAEYGGVYRSKQRFASVGQKTSQANKLEMEVYPNPATTEAEITYTTYSPGRARLVLYNLLGLPVTVITDSYIEAVIHSARISTAELPAGAYFLRLECGGEIVSAPVWVVR